MILFHTPSSDHYLPTMLGILLPNWED
jgi:hypothetical protein